MELELLELDYTSYSSETFGAFPFGALPPTVAWPVSLPSLLLVARSALILPLAAAGVIAVLAASYFAVRRGLDSSAYKLRGLSPQKIADYHDDGGSSPSIERLSESIVERATEISRALEDSPSGIQTEMCALGYRKCANDMITLTHLVNEGTQGANFFRRWRLNHSRKRAISALSEVRESLPPGVLKATRQEF